MTLTSVVPAVQDSPLAEEVDMLDSELISSGSDGDDVAVMDESCEMRGPACDEEDEVEEEDAERDSGFDVVREFLPPTNLSALVEASPSTSSTFVGRILVNPSSPALNPGLGYGLG